MLTFEELYGEIERLPENLTENPMTLLPDWCCEVLSPTTAHDDRAIKLPLYSSSNVAWVWLIDPELRLVEVFETVHGRPALAMIGKEEESFRPPPFEQEIALGPWWLQSRP